MKNIIDNFCDKYKDYLDMRKIEEKYIISFNKSIPIIVYTKLKDFLNEEKEIILFEDNFEQNNIYIIKKIEDVICKYCLKK